MNASTLKNDIRIASTSRVIACWLTAAIFAFGFPHPIQAALPRIAQDFEETTGGWSTIGAGATITITHDPAHVKTGKGALQLNYHVEKGSFSALTLPLQPGALTGIQALRFWIMADTTTPMMMVLQERDGGRYNAVFTAPGGRWQEVLLSPSDFTLSTDPNDPKDPDHKLD